MAVWTIWTGDVWLSIKHPKPLGYSASPTHIIQWYYLHQRCLNYKDSQDNTQILARTFCVLIACVASIPVRLKSFLPTGRTKIGARGKNRQFFALTPISAQLDFAHLPSPTEHMLHRVCSYYVSVCQNVLLLSSSTKNIYYKSCVILRDIPP